MPLQEPSLIFRVNPGYDAHNLLHALKDANEAFPAFEIDDSISTPMGTPMHAAFRVRKDGMTFQLSQYDENHAALTFLDPRPHDMPFNTQEMIKVIGEMAKNSQATHPEAFKTLKIISPEIIESQIDDL